MLWKKSWRRRGGKTVLDFFHFSFTLAPLFFRPFIAPSYLSQLSSVFFPRCTGAKYLSVNVLLRLFNPREGPHGGSKAQR